MRGPIELRLVQTSFACPEQYDVFLGNTQVQVGYLRLRNGYFYASCPGVGGERVYEAHPNGDGSFYNTERDHYLNEAKGAVVSWILRNQRESQPDQSTTEKV